MSLILAPNYQLEQSICDYLTAQNSISGSLLSGSIYTCYTGIGNVDVDNVPAVIVDASEYREVIPFSRCYEFFTKIRVKEMAADTVQIGQLPEQIFNTFVDNVTASNNYTNTGSYNIRIWQVQTLGITPSATGDALDNTLEVRMVGALVPAGS